MLAVALILAGFIGLAAHAEEAVGDAPERASSEPSIVSSSPFLPPDFKRTSTTETPEPPRPAGPNVVTRDLELRGFYEFDGVMNFSIFNRRTDKSHWVQLHERKEGIHVAYFSPENRSIRVNFEGSTGDLTPKEASDSPMPVLSDTGGRDRDAASEQLDLRQRALQQRREQQESGQRPSVPRRRVVLPQQTDSEN